MKAEVKEMPEFTVAYVRKMGQYGKETCDIAFSELKQWAAPKGYLSSGTMLALYWDNPEITKPEKCRVDACVSVPKGTISDGQIALQTISPGLYGVCHFEIQSDDFTQAWDDAFTWLVDSGYECGDKPCYELYHGTSGEGNHTEWIFDICIPLKSD